MPSDDPDRAWRDAYEAAPESEGAKRRLLARIAEPAPRRGGVAALRTAIAFASFVALLGAAWWVQRESRERPDRGLHRVESDRPDVTFTFLAGDAHRVTVVGDFNGWDAEATPLARKGAAGEWSANVPLDPGVHAYAFVVDRHDWREDPSAPRAADRAFGSPRSIVIVDAERTR